MKESFTLLCLPGYVVITTVFIISLSLTSHSNSHTFDFLYPKPLITSFFSLFYFYLALYLIFQTVQVFIGTPLKKKVVLFSLSLYIILYAQGVRNRNNPSFLNKYCRIVSSPSYLLEASPRI